jgi:hypothetical protein
MRKFLLVYIVGLLSFMPNSSISGQQNIPRLEYFLIQDMNYQVNRDGGMVHTAFKPFIYTNHADSIHAGQLPTNRKTHSWLVRKLFHENIINIHAEHFALQINPLLNLELKKAGNADEMLFVNTRGIELMGKLGKSIHFYSSFFENQARFEPYVNEYIIQNLVVPGQGAPKIKPGKPFDFSMASGWLLFDVGKYVNVQFGHSKQFIGEGFRSMLLSDNAFNYPFVKTLVRFGQFEYSIKWSQQQLFETVYYNYHFRKHFSVNYLSWIPKEGLEFGIFEGLVWPGNIAGKKHFSVHFFNPILLFRTFQYGLNNEKNAITGLNAKIKLSRFAQFYTQFALDNFDGKNKANTNFGAQAGIKYFDLLHGHYAKQKLFAQAEFNYISPYTYTHHNPLQSYTHYNQPLAHPAGSGLLEQLFLLNYRYNNLQVRILSSFMVNSTDTLNSNFGSQIPYSANSGDQYLAKIGNIVGQGIKNILFKSTCELIYTMNPQYNLQVFSGIAYRKKSNRLNTESDYFISFGIRTQIGNYYYDF